MVTIKSSHQVGRMCNSQSKKVATPAHHQMQKRHVHLYIFTKPTQVIVRFDSNVLNENQVIEVMRHTDDDVLVVTWSLVVTW